MGQIIRRIQTNGYAVYVYLPRKIIRELEIKPGDFILIERHNDGILLKPIEVRERAEAPAAHGRLGDFKEEVTPRYGGEETRI